MAEEVSDKKIQKLIIKLFSGTITEDERQELRDYKKLAISLSQIQIRDLISMKEN